MSKLKRVFTHKSKLFLILVGMILALSCESPLGDEGTGGGSDGGGGSGGGGTITNKDGKVFPAWYLTEQQQQQNFSMGPTILFDTKRNDGNPNLEANQHYRIPAVIVATNGNIIAIADNRYSHGGDIGTGNNKPIDIVYKISKDGGNTWSEEKIIPPKTPNNSTMTGIDSKGDALVFKALDGTLVCMAVSGGGYSAASSANTPSRMVRSERKNNGETWSSWQEVGQELFEEIKNKHGKKRGFATSGRGLTLKDGTFAAGLSVDGSGKNQGITFVYAYSKDKGMTWTYGGFIPGSADTSITINEPKPIAELENGKILTSSRNAKNPLVNQGENPRLYAVFDSDGGNMPTKFSKWNFRCGNVDAEGVVWTRQTTHDKNRMLHIQAGPNGRNGLKLFLSEDEGQTWLEKKLLLPDSVGACYASIDVAGDGTVITLAEEFSKNGKYYDIVFRRYNMKAITGEVYQTSWYK